MGGDRSLWSEAWREVRQRRMIRGCLWCILAFTLLAAYGEGVYRWSRMTDRTPPYQRVNLQERYLPPSILRHPFSSDRAGSGTVHLGVGGRIRQGLQVLAHHPLGTDNLGRDVLQRVVQGARIAFLVGVVTSLIAIPIGVILGCLAGYFGGWVDEVVVWVYSTVACMPGLLFILAISMVVGKGLTGVYLGIGLTTWVGLCRLIRAEVMKHRDHAYVMAARSLGYSPWRIVFRHILPNVFHLVIITFSLRFPASIGTEVFMSFLGIGVQGEPSWGVMIGNARLRLWQGIWWEMTAVTAAILIVVLAFNLVGDALRDGLDPRLRARDNT
jgi:ABC-type dipeptide/oligopeptide/nickel transport system permease subunit